MSFSLTSWELWLVALSALIVYYLSRTSRAMPLPPGPPGALPFIGHLLALPQSHEWLTYQRWSEELRSDVICLKVLGKHIIIINSLKGATELFEGKASIYSDRPKLYVMRELLGMNWLHGLMPYGKSFLEVRKAANKYLHVEPVKKYRELQLNSARTCLRDLLHAPDDFVQHFREMSGRTILEIAYGIQPQPEDSHMKNVFMAIQALNLGLSPRALLYDAFPLVKWLPDWLPGLGVKKESLQYTSHIAALPDLPLQETRAAMENGSAPNSVAASMITDSDLDNDIIRSVTATMYFAGTETTVATFTNFCLAMLKYPEAQRKAQAEIDAVIGDHRLPDFGDEARLPFTSALVKEVGRWRNVTPLAAPHRLIADDVYNGFFLPKESIVFGNAFAIMHDESVFPDPDVFSPERYLDSSSTKSLDAMFGFGGRLCPGRHLARSTIWITIASILATFTISKALDEDGHEIEVSDEEVSSGNVSYPLPFKCKITPRPKTAEILKLSPQL
ncbi:cytochrome P450 [Mycena epipterygia]|nr:cytochrome P450 [Mycena epipterygia]